MEYIKLKFESIMQANILYYDSMEEAACHDICSQLNIDNLPAIDGVHYFELKNGKFYQYRIQEKHKVNINDSIFDPSALEKLRLNKHNVLFVFDGNVLMGIVHICDFNRDVVLQSIQDDILSFERKMRQLFILFDFKNEHMLDFLNHKMNKSTHPAGPDNYKRKIAQYAERSMDINAFPPFQLFDFTDILKFAESRFSGQVHKIGNHFVDGKDRPGIDLLRELRNMAMHGKNPIVKNRETAVYTWDSLKALRDSLKLLEREYYLVNEKIQKHPDFLKSLVLENRSKLEIIHNHHPKALEFFLGF